MLDNQAGALESQLPYRRSSPAQINTMNEAIINNLAFDSDMTTSSQHDTSYCNLVTALAIKTWRHPQKAKAHISSGPRKSGEEELELFSIFVYRRHPPFGQVSVPAPLGFDAKTWRNGSGIGSQERLGSLSSLLCKLLVWF